MAFSPFARFRNFTVDNLKALLEVYPDQTEKMSWSDVGNEVEEKSPGYKKTSYQQACQFGIEDRGGSTFRVQSYLYTFDDEYLTKYLQFWIKTYYAPNPYVNSDDEPMIIYCEIAREILDSNDLRIDYYDFFNRRIAGKSDDILMNALKSYAAPLKYIKQGENHYFYISENDMDLLRREIDLIEQKYPIPQNHKDKGAFFDRYKYDHFCDFFGIPKDLNVVNGNVSSLENINRFAGAENILLYGVPGVGKSHTIQKDYCSDPSKIERVVFHPDYTYSDFVGQILPRVEDEGKLKYVFTPGPFTKMLKKAYEDPGNFYYLIIEEINRGNAPAIFGEIFQLLDRKDSDKYPANESGESEYGISNYDVASIVYGNADHEVRIPSNMYVLATMNTADQNVFTLDTAFQRRWKMKHIKNEVMKADHAKQTIGGSNITWGAFASVVNDMVIDINVDMASSEDKRLGAYFVKATELGTETFPEKVLKYLWDDAFKLNKEAIFDEKEKSLESVIETFEQAEPDKLKSVLRLNVYQKMLEKSELFKATDQHDEDEEKTENN